LLASCLFVPFAVQPHQFQQLGQRAIAELLDLFRRDRKWNEEAARKQLVILFEAMGPNDPRTIEARRKLSSLMFS